MRTISNHELGRITGGLMGGGASGGMHANVINEHSGSQQPGHQTPGGNVGNIGSDVTDGLCPSDGAALIGYINLISDVAEPWNASELAQAGFEGFSGAMQMRLEPGFQVYCADNNENWHPGQPGDGTLGYCEK